MARCSTRPGRIREARPLSTLPARPVRPLWTLSLSPFFGPLSFLPFVCLHVKGVPARCKVLSRPGVRHPRDGGENRSELGPSASLPGGQTPQASLE